jgi:hypothetical protein
MTEGPQEALTPKGMAKDLAASAVFVLDTALIGYIKSTPRQKHRKV